MKPLEQGWIGGRVDEKRSRVNILKSVVRVFLLGFIGLSLTGACAQVSSKMMQGRYAVPLEFTRDYGYAWKSFQKFPGKDRARLKWSEMWSVLPEDGAAPAKLQNMVVKAGFVKSSLQLEITDHQVFSGALTCFVSAQHRLLVIELFGIGDRLYVMIGGD